MRFTIAIVLTLLIAAAAVAQAGSMHPALEAKLDRAAADEPVSVIVHMAARADIAQLSAALHDSRATRQVRHREVVLSLQQAAQSQQALQNELEQKRGSGGVIGYTGYWISNLMVVYAVKAEIERIAARPDVDFVELNFEIELIEPVSAGDSSGEEIEGASTRTIGVTPGLRAINAPQVWYELGFNGAGRLVGSLDTGVDGTHPAFATRWRGNFHPWQECWLDLVGVTSQFPADSNSHGTHTTGTMCGVAPDDSIGVAWGAQWISCNAIDQLVSPEFDNDILTAFQWFTDPDGDPETVDDVPDVVQNSWGINEGFTGDYTDCDSRWWVVIDNCEFAGVVTVWSAGNEGEWGASTLRSPADRASTPMNCFSVGATTYNPPYPIAGSSSRGPTGCTVPQENRTKPEVCAPGVDIYSSIPGGGYEDGWNGTSMSGPHVAGTVVLMRQANPDLEVDEVKLILMQTAVDLGISGEDNTYGWGFIDAYEAVLAAMTGFGQVAGNVTNRSFNDWPIPGATVELLDSSYRYTTDENGAYIGYAAPGIYTARASADGFEPVEYVVEVIGDQVTGQDFDLLDIAGPSITDVVDVVSTSDTAGPYPVTAMVFDHSTVTDVQLYHSVQSGAWEQAAMVLNEGDYEGSLPGAPAHSRIDYYVWAQDGAGLTSVEPPGAPGEFFSFYITEEMYVYAMEDPEDPSWTMGLPGDQADYGLWTRADPVGIYYNNGGFWIQPEDDHTPDPGVKCFVTGNGPGEFDDDVDGGCTTLLSPTFDLLGADRAFVKYWRWYAEGGFSTDDEFAVDVSADGGTTWVPLERVPTNENSWQVVSVDLNSLITLTNQVVFPLKACDDAIGCLV